MGVRRRHHAGYDMAGEAAMGTFCLIGRIFFV
jgi:hypothetical protein